MNQNIENIENFILKTTIELLKEWESRFSMIFVHADMPIVSNNENPFDYFSEIEVNFWYNDNSFANVFSIIIFLNNKQILKTNEARKYIQEEIEWVYNDCVLQKS